MITEQSLSALRTSLASSMSEKRYRHTIEVENMVIRLGELYAPEKILILRAAALLHDITKEYSSDHHLMIFAQKGLSLTREDLLAPKTFHARTAAALIGESYPELAEDEVISCVRWHTTGRRGMTICEKLLYLADYIDDSRTFSSCVLLRRYFFGAEPELMTKEELERHLRATLLLSYEHTLKDLLSEGAPIDEDTIRARNELLVEEAKAKNN